MNNKEKRYHFVYEQAGNDKQLWVHASGFAAAYDIFWSKMDGEEIEKIEVEQYHLKPAADVEEIFEWVPDGII